MLMLVLEKCLVLVLKTSYLKGLHPNPDIYIYIYMCVCVTCHSKTRPSGYSIILRKTITNMKHELSINFVFFIYHESTMTHLRGDTFEIFR